MDDTQNIEAIISKEIGSLVSRKFLLAFSGGVDSVVLLDLLVNVLKESDALRIIHINHNLNHLRIVLLPFDSPLFIEYLI